MLPTPDFDAELAKLLGIVGDRSKIETVLENMQKKMKT